MSRARLIGRLLVVAALGPHAVASVGTILGVLAIAWSITFVVAVERR